MSDVDCRVCGKPFSLARQELGYKTCLKCGDVSAEQARKSWCVIQEYGKGGYQFVTPETALHSLKGTNQKNVRT